MRGWNRGWTQVIYKEKGIYHAYGEKQYDMYMTMGPGRESGKML